MRATASCQGFALLAVAASCAAASAGRADDAVAWLDVAAERPVDHAVMIRGPFAAAHEKVALRGPVAVVSPEPVADSVACFTVYQIAAAVDEPARTVDVAEARAVRLGPPEFLLVPAKRLADGPAAGPGDADVYEARPILDPRQGIDGMPAAGGQPTHVCLPVDYRHHFEHVAAGKPDRGLVLFAPHEGDVVPSVIPVVDDFGTNRLVPARMARSGSWVTVPAGGAR